MKRGLWIDRRAGRRGIDGIADLDYLRELKGLGFSSLAVMLDGPLRGFDSAWTDGAFATFCERAISLDLEVIATTWPDPDERMIMGLGQRLRRWAGYGIIGVEVDLEGQWRVAPPRYEQVSAALVEELLAVREAHDVRVETTTHTGHREATERALVTPRADRFLCQAYSVAVHSGKTLPWDDPIYGPGRAQERAARLARRVPGVPGRVKLGLGLPLWAQSWPGRSTAEAMQTALDAAEKVEPCEVRYWSSKWLTGEAKRWLAATVS